MSESEKVSAGRVQQAGRTAQEEAAATAGRAREASGEVVGTAREQARAVTGEARDQARTVVRDLRERATDEARSQTERTAGTLRKWADDFARLAENAPGDSPAGSLAAQAADGGRRAADYVDKRGVEGLAEDVQGFARRRPGVFLGGAVLAGFAVGRLAKAGGKAARSDGGPSAQPPAPGQQSLPEEAARPERAELPDYPEV